MSHAEVCPICHGTGKTKIITKDNTTCHGCGGKGGIEVSDPYPLYIPLTKSKKEWWGRWGSRL
jgi:DnaJ-class molecular chaperone